MNIFSCDLEIKSSHNVNDIEFSGKSFFVLDKDVCFSCPYGNEETRIEVFSYEDGKIKIRVSSEEIGDKEAQGEYLKKIAILISSLLGFREQNPYYGTPFVTLDLHTFYSRSHGGSSEALVQISDSFSLKSTKAIKFSACDFASIHEIDFLKYYYDGLKAEGEKSKFFHFFLILEMLESCDLYKRLFPQGTLFTKEDNKEIKEFASRFSEAKKSALLHCLSRTEKSRSEKLLCLISQIGIKNLHGALSTQQIDINLISRLIKARNSLFHKSASFESGLLYNILFPLVSKIVERILKDPECIL